MIPTSPSSISDSSGLSHTSQPQPRARHSHNRGGTWIITIGVIVVLLCLSALAVDMGYYFTTQNRLQTAADAAVLAGTHKLFAGTATTVELRQQDARDEAVTYGESNHPDLAVKTEDIEFGFVDPTTLQYNSGSFTTPSTLADYKATGGFNAMRVTVRMDDTHGGALPTIFANLFNVHKVEPFAQSVAIMDNKIGSVVAGGLRPIYACNVQHEAAVTNAQENGMPLQTQPVRIYGDRFMLNGSAQSCPLPGSGNWGFADFSDCDPGSPGNSTVSDWFANGYPGSIQLGQCYSTAPGNFLKSNEVKTALDNLISNQTIVLVPLISDFQGTGSQTSVTIVGYSGFVFTNVFTQGNQADWYVEGYFTNATCTTQCQGNPASIGGGVAKLRLMD